MNSLLYKRAQRQSLAAKVFVVFICLLSLQSCGGDNKSATECFELQETLNRQHGSFVGTVTKASETAKAEAHKASADALLAVELTDIELQERRDRIASFNKQLHTIGLQSADVMTDDGLLSGSAADQYRTISDQRIAIYDQLSTEMNSLQIHCSLQ